jgi:hypothetical protein
MGDEMSKRESDKWVGKPDSPEVTGKEMAQAGADDRGGSRDGERLDPGEPGDRGQLDNDGGLDSAQRRSRRDN